VNIVEVEEAPQLRHLAGVFKTTSMVLYVVSSLAAEILVVTRITCEAWRQTHAFRGHAEIRVARHQKWLPMTFRPQRGKLHIFIGWLDTKRNKRKADGELHGELQQAAVRWSSVLCMPYHALHEQGMHQG
jgi:hypothetical protein